MLMLIMFEMYKLMCYMNFNTSHVNVNLDDYAKECAMEANFNTSHVNVNLNAFSALCWLYALFQYISC